jgi:hypothetical protein
MKRRSLLRWALGAASFPAWHRIGRGTAEPPVAAALDPEAESTLRVLAATVLPESLGPERLNEIADSFLAWIRRYREGSDLDHGYGHTAIKASGPSPAAGYAAQLRALERSALERGASFASSALGTRRDLVAAALGAAQLHELPGRPEGRHVAADLMAFFFSGSEANDLCYGAAIGRDTCRGLGDSDRAPDPLPGARK